MISRRLVVRVLLGFALAGVTLVTAAAQKPEAVYVLGYVKNPGAYTFKADMTVGDALDAAGGFSANHAVTSIEVIRKVDGATETASATLGDPVRPNDTIRVR
jgi:protein involved in polysaccharide export with SLBB domain